MATPRTKNISRDNIQGCFLLGACGDALGAPIEEIRDLKTIQARYGDKGLSDIIAFDNVFGSGVSYPAGRITDDTTMAMTTAAALLLAQDPADWKELKPLLWQGYLQWGQRQEDGAGLDKKLDETVPWTEQTRKFWFFCGAGRGTIAALQQDEPGSVASPLTYDCVIRGKRTTGPNAGCGGMMRVAPQALLDVPAEKIFELACENAALTHGAPEAYVATGAVALLIHFAARGENMAEALRDTRDVLAKYAAQPEYKDGIVACEKALDAAETAAAAKPADLETIDGLPRELGYENPFLAVPVLSQTAYALLSTPVNPDQNGIRAAMAVAVNHSGDSDSVGAIVGNVLGARYGTAVIPGDWLDTLIQRREIETMADNLAAALNPPPPAPKAKGLHP
jgi:ADP-ribosylglycohydrolase